MAKSILPSDAGITELYTLSVSSPSILFNVPFFATKCKMYEHLGQKKAASGVMFWQINNLPIQSNEQGNAFSFHFFFLLTSSFFLVAHQRAKQQILGQDHKVSTNAERQKSAFFSAQLLEKIFSRNSCQEGLQTNDGAAMPCNHKASVSQEVKCLPV